MLCGNGKRPLEWVRIFQRRIAVTLKGRKASVIASLSSITNVGPKKSAFANIRSQGALSFAR